MESSTPAFKSPQTVKLSLDLRWVAVALLVIIAAMLLMWKPWHRPVTDSRTINVSGDAKVTATPDEFVFYPSYQSKNSDKAAALKELADKSNQVVTALKKLGVADKDIKTNGSGYDYPIYYGANSGDATYDLQITVTVNNKDLAQKVQDYLLTTTPTGSVTPQASFSDQKRKSLESTARDQATKDARAKADQMGKNLGFKVGKVKSVDDGSGFEGIVRPMIANGMASSAEDKSTSLTVQPGENELPYSVTVVYYIR
jgi:uncharacterized protein